MFGKVSRREFLCMSAAAPIALSLARQQTPPSDRLRVGIIGAGGRGQGLMEVIKKMPDIEIVAVCDAYKGRLQRAIERTDGKAQPHDDYRKMLDLKDVDAIIIATPDHLHGQMLVDSIAAGKDVYIEKPLSYSIEDGKRMIAAARNSDRIIQVGSQGISSIAQKRARELVASGAIGQVTMVRATYNRNTASGAWVYPIPPDASPETVDWERFLGPAPRRSYDPVRFFRWRCFWDYSGGIATDLFVHLLTTIHYIMNAEMPSSVVATGALYRWKDGRDVPDTFNALMEYPEGFTVNLSSTFNNQITAEGSLQFLGTQGAIELRGGALMLYPERPVEGHFWMVDSWPRALRDEFYKDPKNAQAEFLDRRQPSLELSQQRFDQVGPDATYLHLRDFFDSARSRKQPIEPIEVGHRAAAAAHLANKSYREKRIVFWDRARGAPA
jgi:predicted dehydrogenase